MVAAHCDPVSETILFCYLQIQSVPQVLQIDVQQQSDSECLAEFAQANCSQSTITDEFTLNNPASATPRPRPKKRSREIVKAINDVKMVHYKLDSEEDTQFDVFGKSVAMQLKKLSVENALMAQQKIQRILTEIGITDYRKRRDRTASSISDQSVQTPASYSSDDERQTPETE